MTSETQLLLFPPPKCPRNARREPAHIYAAVLALRAKGHTCYRAGRHAHTVDGFAMGDEKLLRYAARAGWTQKIARLVEAGRSRPVMRGAEARA